ncbi:Uncharacterized protein EJ110_NYTH02345 [Nymphaea thermarum]|nr:Uncharacterized protein EJ110_NYTH02345 [Nymphaea thermarum]
MDAVERSVQAKYECLLFDMDDTLYPLSAGLNLACRKNIEEYMINHLNIDEKEVPKMCLELYREHGTTMAGLKALGFELDNDEFHEYVHGRLPYENLKPDPVLRNLLLSMPQRKIIFTNADKAHAAKVLSKLGLEDCFEGVICFETLNPSNDNHGDLDHFSMTETGVDNIDSDDSSEYETDESVSGGCSHIVCKPSPEAFHAAIRLANVDPKKTIFFDDSVRNISTAKTTGLVTVIVGKEALVPGADFALNSIHNIREAIPEIWECGEEEQMEQVLPLTGIETVVLA